MLSLVPDYNSVAISASGNTIDLRALASFAVIPVGRLFVFYEEVVGILCFPDFVALIAEVF